jgi:hypothetical protein
MMCVCSEIYISKEMTNFRHFDEDLMQSIIGNCVGRGEGIIFSSHHSLSVHDSDFIRRRKEKNTHRTEKFSRERILITATIQR